VSNLLDAEARAAWLEDRRGWLGATDAVAVLGFSPYRTPRQVYDEKMGNVASGPMTERMKWGLIHEPQIAREYAEQTGLRVRKSPGYRLRPPFDFLGASPDYLVKGLAPLHLMDCKCSEFARDFGDPGTCEIPEHYRMQVLWQMGLVKMARRFEGDPLGDLAVLVSGNSFRVYQVPWSAEAFAEMFEGAVAWWHTHIVADCPPPLEAADTVSIAADSALPPMVATPEVDDLLANLSDSRKVLKLTQAGADAYANRLREVMGAATELTSPRFGTVTWKPNAKGQRSLRLPF